MGNLKDKESKHFLINNIISVFSEIDLEIAKLQDCSESDFKTFNLAMKKSHANAKQISTHADEIIDLSSISKNKKIIENLKDEYSNLCENCDIFKKDLKNQNHLLSEFLDRVRYLSLPFKNLKQNLFALKYILANLKLETHQKKNVSSNLIKIKTIEQNIQKNTLTIKKIELKLASLQISLEEQVSIKASKTLQDFEEISNSFESLNNVVNLLQKEYKESETYYPKIKNKIEQASESINKIVIKLQYQDIIRQKMEHMQIIYKKIIDYFDNIEKEDAKEDDKVLQYYSKIEYIASLQVAQLIQTNKEYEQAIESISEQLLQITLSVNDISFYFRIFTTELPKHEEIFLQWTKKYLEQIKTGQKNIQQNKSSFINSFRNLKNDLQDFKLLFIEVEEISLTTTQFIEELNIDEDTNFSKTINLKKLKEVGGNIDKIVVSIRKNFDQINPDIWSLSNLDHAILNLDANFLANIESKIEKIESNEEVLDTILKKSINLAKKISTEVIDSIKKVSYYDFFEKSIEQIIAKLNFLNEKLKFERSDVTPEDIADLIKLENMYTVKTEKDIHDLIVNNGNLEATEKLENIENNEDSEVEFF